MGLLQKLFGTHSENELKRIYPIVDRIEALEPEMQKLSDQELKEKQRSSSGVWKREKHWMISFRRHLPLSERRQSGHWECATTVYS